MHNDSNMPAAAWDDPDALEAWIHITEARLAELQAARVAAMTPWDLLEVVFMLWAEHVEAMEREGLRGLPRDARGWVHHAARWCLSGVPETVLIGRRLDGALQPHRRGAR